MRLPRCICHTSRRRLDHDFGEQSLLLCQQAPVLIILRMIVAKVEADKKQTRLIDSRENRRMNQIFLIPHVTPICIC